MCYAADVEIPGPGNPRGDPDERPARPGDRSSSTSLNFRVTSFPPADLSQGERSRCGSSEFHARSASRQVHGGRESMDLPVTAPGPARSQDRGAKDPPDPFETSR